MATRNDLRSLRCEACEGRMPALERREVEELRRQLHERWRIADDARSLHADVTFKSFRQAMAFLNRAAEVAEAEGHHPDFCLHGWNKVSLDLSTHTIGGLSMNDLILAAKLDPIVEE